MLNWFRRKPPAPLRRSFYAMGTEVTLTLAPRHARDLAAAEQAFAETERTLVEFGRDWWAWGPGALSQLNRRLEAGDVVDITPAMRPLFERAWALREASGGRFDPRVAPLVRLWGFDDVARIRSEPPAAADIDALMAALKAAPAYDGGDRYGPAPGIYWDFGGIAKGYIIDRMLERLAAIGFANATLDAGGNLAVRGARADRPWHIGIRRPLLPHEDIDAPALLASLDACDESVNTHGDDQRFFIHDGRRYAHLLDPTTGWPVRGLRSITVVHRDGALAEAGGAALFVAGPNGWRALARTLGIEQVLVVHDDGLVQTTAALAPRLRSHGETRIVVVP